LLVHMSLVGVAFRRSPANYSCHLHDAGALFKVSTNSASLGVRLCSAAFEETADPLNLGPLARSRISARRPHLAGTSEVWVVSRRPEE
jgi:hypothetical protein